MALAGASPAEAKPDPGALTETRTWTDISGKFEIEAVVIARDDKKVTLRRPDGKEIVVPVDKLSRADQKFLRELEGDESGGDESGEGIPSRELRDLAEKFFKDLLTEERAEAGAMLTAEAQQAASKGEPPLKKLPTPDEHRRAIRVGKAEGEGDTAAVEVRVRVGGDYVETMLHFRNQKAGRNQADGRNQKDAGKQQGDWRVFALSAQLPSGEQTINFEAASAAGSGAADPITALLGKPMPLQGLTVGGQPFDIRQYQGKVVLVDFWATWCGHCLEEMPNIAANYQKHHERGFEVVAVSVDRSMESLTGFVAEQNPPWVVLADNHPNNPQSMAAHYGITGVPALALVGPDGIVVAVHCRGERLGQEVEKALAALPRPDKKTPRPDNKTRPDEPESDQTAAR